MSETLTQVVSINQVNKVDGIDHLVFTTTEPNKDFNVSTGVSSCRQIAGKPISVKLNKEKNTFIGLFGIACSECPVAPGCKVVNKGFFF